MPATEQFTVAAPASLQRSHASATLLADGKVMITGGESITGRINATVEIYDPMSNQWSVFGRSAIARERHSATLMPNGDVVLIGGSLLLDAASRSGETLR